MPSVPDRGGTGGPDAGSDGLWEIVEPLIPPQRKRPQGGGTRFVDDRAVFAAITYVLTTGCAGGICRRSSGCPRPPPTVGWWPGPRPGRGGGCTERSSTASASRGWSTGLERWSIWSCPVPGAEFAARRMPGPRWGRARGMRMVYLRGLRTFAVERPRPGRDSAGSNWGAFSIETFTNARPLSYTHEGASGWLAHLGQHRDRNFWFTDANGQWQAGPDRLAGVGEAVGGVGG